MADADVGMRKHGPRMTRMARTLSANFSNGKDNRVRWNMRMARMFMVKRGMTLVIYA